MLSFLGISVTTMDISLFTTGVELGAEIVRKIWD